MSTAKPYSLTDLITIMQRLRDPENGCPWDKKQTFSSIVPSTLEEAYEVAETIEQKDYDHLEEELGDLLFQVIFYCQLGQEEQRFDFDGVVSGLAEKLLRRHPHVFHEGELHRSATLAPMEDDNVIKQQWETLKQEEREAKGQKSVLADIPLNFPALSRSQKLQKRASNVGFDWKDINDVVAKAEEELQELKQALAAQEKKAIAEELGDLLFSVVNIARHCKEDAESLLRAGNRKFQGRFEYIESQLAGQAKQFKDVELDEMEALWQLAKSRENAL